MSVTTRKTPLEPIAPALSVVVMVHLLGGMMLWILLPLWNGSYSFRFSEKIVTDHDGSDGRYWFAPASFSYVAAKSVPNPITITAPEPVKTHSENLVSSLLENQMIAPHEASQISVRPANKIITLSPVVEGDSGIPTLESLSRMPMTMMQMLKQQKQQEADKQARADMDPVLKALEQSLKNEWIAPQVQSVPQMNRDTRLTIRIGRDGSILETQMTKSSGSPELDQSVMEAGARLKKISQALPSSFPKDSYTVAVNFHIE